MVQVSPATTNEQNLQKDCRWIFHGHIVIPTKNPFFVYPETASKIGSVDARDGSSHIHHDQQQHENQDSLWLGPGLVIRINHILVVNVAGIITHLEPAHKFFATELSEAQCRAHDGYVRLDDDKNTSFLCPGLIDLHIHAAQYAFAGTATDRPLMGPTGWLETYTFPTEARMRDLQFARQVYERVVSRTLSFGTTTAVYFATLDVEPTKVLVDVALEYGQRALIGKVCMDRHSPETYCQSVEQNLKETREIISYIRSHPSSKKQQ